LAGAATKSNAIINDRLKRAKEAGYRFIENGENNQQLIKQNIKLLELFPDDHEAKQLVTQLSLKLLH
jgi:alkaline phosphatase